MTTKQRSVRLRHSRANRGGAPCRSSRTLIGLLLSGVLGVTFASDGLAQTTRTNRSAAPTTPSLPSSSSTSPNSPCDASNPTSSCFSARAPGNPCYSAVGDPCSKTTTPASSSLPSQPSSAPPTPAKAIRAITVDQARAAIEAGGYSKVEQLRKDAEGVWRGKAEIDGDSVNVSLRTDGTITKD